MREFLAGFLNHKRERFQLAAMKALGTLEDPKAMALLQPFASASMETPQQKAAEKAIAALRTVNKPSDNLKDLRQEVLDVKKENQRLSKELGDVKKRLNAIRRSNRRRRRRSRPTTGWDIAIEIQRLLTLAWKVCWSASFAPGCSSHNC